MAEPKLNINPWASDLCSVYQCDTYMRHIDLGFDSQSPKGDDPFYSNELIQLLYFYCYN